MFTIKLLCVFGALIHVTWARREAAPFNDESLSFPSVPIQSDTNQENVPIPTDGVVNGLIVKFTSPGYIKIFEPVPVETEETSSASGEKLVRKKRFLFNLVGSVLQSFRNDNWRECGRTPWGTTIYTNGFTTACFGACPQDHEAHCGYGYGGYGYGGTQINSVHIG